MKQEKSENRKYTEIAGECPMTNGVISRMPARMKAADRVLWFVSAPFILLGEMLQILVVAPLYYLYQLLTSFFDIRFLLLPLIAIPAVVFKVIYAIIGKTPLREMWGRAPEAYNFSDKIFIFFLGVSVFLILYALIPTIIKKEERTEFLRKCHVSLIGLIYSKTYAANYKRYVLDVVAEDALKKAQKSHPGERAYERATLRKTVGPKHYGLTTFMPDMKAPVTVYSNVTELAGWTKAHYELWDIKKATIDDFVQFINEYGMIAEHLYDWKRLCENDEDIAEINTLAKDLYWRFVSRNTDFNYNYYEHLNSIYEKICDTESDTEYVVKSTELRYQTEMLKHSDAETYNNQKEKDAENTDLDLYAGCKTHADVYRRYKGLISFYNDTDKAESKAVAENTYRYIIKYYDLA